MAATGWLIDSWLAFNAPSVEIFSDFFSYHKNDRLRPEKNASHHDTVIYKSSLINASLHTATRTLTKDWNQMRNL